MKTRLICLALLLCCVGASAAVTQNAKWKSVPFKRWGFSLKIPPSAVHQPLAQRLPSGSCDVFASDGFAYVVQVSPTSSEGLASTVIEQAIQADMKNAARLGPETRWETTSKQGDLFKGFTTQVQLSKADPTQAVVIKALGTERGVQSVAMASLKDESGPVLRVSVVGTADREAEVVAMAKEIASLAATKPQMSEEAPAPKPATSPAPAPAAKAFPELRNGLIELAGKVDSVSRDGKIVMMTIDTVKVVGQDPVTLSPARVKRVLLKGKLEWITQGQYVHLIGKNTGEGKPIQADAIEKAPEPTPKPESPHPMPLS